ncbi:MULTISPECIES: cobalt transporter CbiM [unclassified Desulfovibrio]|uniref:cobalt transporter CbiM n=1 Tax=unclassified Desulfovibrio TaxID=2593640 RepID=UPI0013EC13E8|nr:MULTISPECIES: cobalt transporter CbiM [unclassified Desulfovibrio]
MHIAEGVLSPAVLGAGAALGAAGVALGLRHMDGGRLMEAGILSAAFFVGSLIHVPIGVTSAHLLLTGLLGVLLGWAAFPAILAALLLQALLFQYGGLTTLGVNTFTMGTSAVVAWYAWRGIRRLWPGPAGEKFAAFCGGALGVALSALLTALALAFTNEGFVTAARLLLLAHLPVMAAEGFVTMITVAFIARVRPEMLAEALPVSAPAASPRKED